MYKIQASTSISLVKYVNYDGALHGKCGVYYRSDGEVVYIYPDDENIVFVT